MHNYCQVNSSTQVADEFPCQAYLSVYASCKSAKDQVGVRAGQHVSGDQLFMSTLSGQRWYKDLKQVFIGQQNYSHALLLGNL